MKEDKENLKEFIQKKINIHGKDWLQDVSREIKILEFKIGCHDEMLRDYKRRNKSLETKLKKLLETWNAIGEMELL